ncbi:hypothetical protein SELMODRAFT_421706 [Selaginella moellendorffii]|uniref:Uncharacterized protein n=1 Tax=Selaginella moellendorffii TaxID=88036 RepID=D8SG43_SELML|nr:hypothetical protein SELMODRAFT_421706 [Selaginella moellendorffii]
MAFRVSQSEIFKGVQTQLVKMLSQSALLLPGSRSQQIARIASRPHRFRAQQSFPGNPKVSNPMDGWLRSNEARSKNEGCVAAVTGHKDAGVLVAEALKRMSAARSLESGAAVVELASSGKLELLPNAFHLEFLDDCFLPGNSSIGFAQHLKDPSSFKILAADSGHACAFCGFLVGMELDADGRAFRSYLDRSRKDVCCARSPRLPDQDCGYWLSSDDQSINTGASGLNAAVVIREVMPGELVCIDGTGTTSSVQFNAGERSLECGIEVFIQSSWNYRIHRLRQALCKRLPQLPLPEVWIRAVVIADGRENDRLAEEFAKAKGFSYSRIGHHSFGELVRGNRVLVVGSSYQRALESVTRLKGGEYGPGAIHVLLFSPVVTMDCCYSKLATMVSQQEVDVKWLPVEDFYDVVAQETGKTPCCACLRNA